MLVVTALFFFKPTRNDFSVPRRAVRHRVRCSVIGWVTGIVKFKPVVVQKAGKLSAYYHKVGRVCVKTSGKYIST